MLMPGWMLHFVGDKERFWARSGAYAPKTSTQYTAKWGGQNGVMIFQTRSGAIPVYPLSLWFCVSKKAPVITLTNAFVFLLLYLILTLGRQLVYVCH